MNLCVPTRDLPEVILDDLAGSSRRERVAFGGEIGPGDRLGYRGGMIDGRRRHPRNRQPNAFEPAADGRAPGRRGDRYGLTGSAHAKDRQNVADSVDDCDRRVDAARLRFADRLRDDLLDVRNRQAGRRSAAAAAAPAGVVGAIRCRNGIAA